MYSLSSHGTARKYIIQYHGWEYDQRGRTAHIPEPKNFVPWDREANFRLPISVWKEMMEMHFPNTAWLCLRRDVFEQLYQYKVRHGIPTWEQAISRALAAAETTNEVKA